LTTSPLDAASPLEAGSGAVTQTAGAPDIGRPDVLFDVEAENTSVLETVLDNLRRAATDKRDQGDKFERLMVRFFQTDREWSQRFDAVWTWMDWPERPAQADLGIDLVARDRETSGYVAIQCKFYDPHSTIYKHHIDSFLAESGRHQFRDRIIVTTTDKWGANAEQAIEGQQIPVQRVRFMDLAQSSIDWLKFDLSRPDEMVRKDRKHLRPHQIAARDAVRAGFATGERGKLIMACGTGKTFTSLRIAEELAGPAGRVLFLVPSISLLNQSLHEWSIEAELPLRTFAVCSDSTVGKVRNLPGESSEDSHIVDLALPSTTDPARLHARLTNTAAAEDKLTVIFSTYQSIDVVAAAQQLGSPAFDLIICDEAHRTTGVTLAGQDESAFVRVHDDAYLHAARRLYMTATPRLYDDSSKAKAGQASAVIASMDDEATYGPELYRLGFGEAVSKGLLTDYKVFVLGVDEKEMSAALQSRFALDSELQIDDAAKIVGCWNGLAKRKILRPQVGVTDVDDTPMRRAVAFAGTIANSKKFAAQFTDIITQYLASQEQMDLHSLGDGDDSVDGADSSPDDPDDAADGAPLLRCEVEHVDGTVNVLERGARLDWLKETPAPDTCRILTNARCLSEGVDVPSLDAVIFLNPRRSHVDIVQSVGRVMRLAHGKQYGYIILPVAVPDGVTPEEALSDNKRYEVVWQVLQALRAHDERFNAMINQIDLNHTTGGKIEFGFIGHNAPDDSDTGSQPSSQETPAGHVQSFLPLTWPTEWRNAILARIVTKVGNRRYWEQWAGDIAVIAERHTTRIRALLDHPGLGVADTFDQFLAGLRKNLNDSISRDGAIDMLAQHLITRPVFEALFSDYSFAEHNPVSKSMQAMLDALDEQNVDTEAATLEKFYDSVRQRAQGIENAEGKQKIITELYEKFFKLAFPRAAESLGIVYTPVEIVDFIIRSVDRLLRIEFSASLSDENVHVLDPFTGTGTFIARMLQSGLIRPEDLLRKYTRELHANEILLLAYYIAAINIEATFHGLITQDGGLADTVGDGGYAPFDGIVLTDTFHLTEAGGFDDVAIPANSKRARAQRDLDIRVIIGNPPYSVGQTSGNDNNANLRYPALDDAIARTYAKRSTAQNKNSLYDSYIRAFRWASDRIKDKGIISFVSNGAFIDSNTADGFRKSLAAEFTSIYVFNLRGNQRTGGDLSRREGGKIFGSGSRNTVAITLLVKNPDKAGPAEINYRDIGDYLDRGEKLTTVDRSDVDSMDWSAIEPNEAGDWINQRNDTFQTFQPLSPKEDPAKSAIFDVRSAGLQTNRDAWVYNYSATRLHANIEQTVEFYNEEMGRFAELKKRKRINATTDNVGDFISSDATKISWSRSLKSHLLKGTKIATRGAFGIGAYRPFSKQFIYYDRFLNHERAQLPRIFPTPDSENIGFYVTGIGSDKQFSVFATDLIPDLAFWGSSNGQFFPRYTFGVPDPNDLFAGGVGQRIDNISDRALADYRGTYGAEVSKDDIFYYVYGLLHSPEYRAEFAADLKKMLPRIPRVSSADDFQAFVAAGQELATLHIGYEAVEPYPLLGTEEPLLGLSQEQLYDFYRVEKMRFGGKGANKDRSTIIYNSRITVSGIPDTAHEYLLGSRSGIEWVIERYQVKADKASGIINDPNDWSRELGDPRYILDLLARVVTVSVESLRIVDGLPALALG